MVVSSCKMGKTKRGTDNESYNQELEIGHAKMSIWPLLIKAFLGDNCTANACCLKPLDYVRIPRGEK